MTRFAKGKKAVGYDERSGRKTKLRKLRSDGQYPGILVTDAWYEPKHPQETPVDPFDPVGLRDPSPDRDKPGIIVDARVRQNLWDEAAPRVSLVIHVSDISVTVT